MVHPGGTVRGVGAGVFQSSAADGLYRVSGASENVRTVFAGEVANKFVVVDDIAFVNIGPCVDYDIVSFIGIARVVVVVFVGGVVGLAFEGCNRFAVFCLDGSASCCMATACIVKVPFGYVVAVLDLGLRGSLVFGKELFHVTLEGRYA